MQANRIQTNTNKVVLIITGKNKTDKQHKTEIERARIIMHSLGVKVAARYLVLRQWSIDAALWVLLGATTRGT